MTAGSGWDNSVNELVAPLVTAQLRRVSRSKEQQVFLEMACWVRGACDTSGEDTR